MLWHPHGYSWNTPPHPPPSPKPPLSLIWGRLFQHVVSGWKATQKRCGSTRPGQNVSLIGINTMTSSGRIRETLKTAWKVYHNSSDHNGSVFLWDVDLRIHNIYKSCVLVPATNLQREISRKRYIPTHYWEHQWEPLKSINSPKSVCHSNQTVNMGKHGGGSIMLWRYLS